MAVKNKQPRIVIDTNIFISFLIGKSFAELKEKIIHQNFILLISDELLVEIFEVVNRKKFKKYFSPFKSKNYLQC